MKVKTTSYAAELRNEVWERIGEVERVNDLLLRRWPESKTGRGSALGSCGSPLRRRTDRKIAVRLPFLDFIAHSLFVVFRQQNL